MAIFEGVLASPRTMKWLSMALSHGVWPVLVDFQEFECLWARLVVQLYDRRLKLYMPFSALSALGRVSNATFQSFWNLGKWFCCRRPSQRYVQTRRRKHARWGKILDEMSLKGNTGEELTASLVILITNRFSFLLASHQSHLWERWSNWVAGYGSFMLHCPGA